MDVNDIIDKICILESRVRANDEQDALGTVKEIREAFKSVTHMFVLISTSVLRLVDLQRAPSLTAFHTTMSSARLAADLAYSGSR